jgi:hypothetical protein
MANAKQEVFKLLETLPEEASLEDIQYHLYVLQCIGRGRQDVEAGRTLPQDEAERRMAVRIVITPLSSPHRTRAIEALCAELNRAPVRFPGTRLPLFHAVAGAR